MILLSLSEFYTQNDLVDSDQKFGKFSSENVAFVPPKWRIGGGYKRNFLGSSGLLKMKRFPKMTSPSSRLFFFFSFFSPLLNKPSDRVKQCRMVFGRRTMNVHKLWEMESVVVNINVVASRIIATIIAQRTRPSSGRNEDRGPNHHLFLNYKVKNWLF